MNSKTQIKRLAIQRAARDPLDEPSPAEKVPLIGVWFPVIVIVAVLGFGILIGRCWI